MTAPPPMPNRPAKMPVRTPPPATAAARTANSLIGTPNITALFPTGTSRGHFGRLACDQTKGREELAHYFAFDTDLTAETVLLALSKSPAAKTNLDSAMAREAQPKLGAGIDRASGEPPRMISTEEVYARRRAAVAAVSQR